MTSKSTPPTIDNLPAPRLEVFWHKGSEWVAGKEIPIFVAMYSLVMPLEEGDQRLGLLENGSHEFKTPILRDAYDVEPDIDNLFEDLATRPYPTLFQHVRADSRALRGIPAFVIYEDFVEEIPTEG